MMNTFLDGVSYAGETAEVTLPKIAMKTEDWRAGGMTGPVPIDMGLDKIEVEFSAGGLLLAPIRQFGAARHDAAMIRWAGSYRSDSNGRVSAVEIVARGRYAELDLGKAKVGDDTEQKFKMAASYYKLTVDGEELLEIDMVSGIFVSGGIDRNAELRAAIGL
jgi:phage contractile tail tube protein, P2 family